MKSLVIGSGLIGQALYYHLRKFGEVGILGHGDIDLMGNYVVPSADVTYICAGKTKTEECEQNPVGTRAVNVEGTIQMAESIKGGVVWISSERVFDGSVPFRKVGDKVCPTTEYGRQKAETEKAILNMGHTVVRFSKVLGYDIPMFGGWVEDLAQGKAIHPFSNTAMAPVSVNFAVDTLRRIGNQRLKGLYQVSGDRDLSYARVAYHIANHLGYPVSLVQPVSAEKPHPFTTLENNLQCIGVDAPNSWDAIYRWCES